MKFFLPYFCDIFLFDFFSEHRAVIFSFSLFIHFRKVEIRNEDFCCELIIVFLHF